MDKEAAEALGWYLMVAATILAVAALVIAGKIAL